MIKYKEVDPKPESLSEAKEQLYYMSSNNHDTLGEGYSVIDNDECLYITCKVYTKVCPTDEHTVIAAKAVDVCPSQRDRFTSKMQRRRNNAKVYYNAM